MRIAQIAPLYESVPPRWYGGTERVVAYLTDALVKQGHDVTLFASGDSRTLAELVPVCPRALRLDDTCRDPIAWHVLLVEQVARCAAEFDLLHFHVSQIHYPLARRLRRPHLTTLHGRLDLPELVWLYREFREVPVVSISDAQRTPLPHANWIATVQHGLPPDLLRFQPHDDGYFAFLGRISPEKRVDRAIQIATALGRPLRIAAKVDRVDQDYFDACIKPLLDHPLIDYIGEIAEPQKSAFLGQAAALLFPVEWPEPFGLVMIEALACGTPVIAFRRGSVPEVIEHGVTGYIVDTIDEAIAAGGRIDEIDRRACRRAFERRYTAGDMAENYVRVYQALIGRSTTGQAVA